MAQRRSPTAGISIIARHGESIINGAGVVEKLLYWVRSGRYDLDVTYTESEETARSWCQKAQAKHRHSPFRHTDLVASVCPFPAEGATAATAVCVIRASDVLIYRGELPQCVRDMLLVAYVRPLWIDGILALVASEGAAHQLLAAAAPEIGVAAPVIGAADIAMGVADLVAAEDAVPVIVEAGAGASAGAVIVEAGAGAVIVEAGAGASAGAGAVIGEAGPWMAVVMQAEAPPIHVIYEAVQLRPAVKFPEAYFNWNGQARDELGIMYAAHLAFMSGTIF